MPVNDMLGFSVARPPVNVLGAKEEAVFNSWEEATKKFFNVTPPRVIRSNSGGTTFTVLFGSTLRFGTAPSTAQSDAERRDVFSFDSDLIRFPNTVTWEPTEPKEPSKTNVTICILSGHMNFNQNRPDIYQLGVNYPDSRVLPHTAAEWIPWRFKIVFPPQNTSQKIVTQGPSIMASGRCDVELMYPGDTAAFLASHPAGKLKALIFWRLSGDTELLHGGGQKSGPTWNSMAYGWAIQSAMYNGTPKLLSLQKGLHDLDNLFYHGCFVDKDPWAWGLGFGLGSDIGDRAMDKQNLDQNEVASKGIVLACRDRARNLKARLFSVQAGTECYTSFDEPGAKKYGVVMPNGDRACWHLDKVSGLNSGGGYAMAMYSDAEPGAPRDPDPPSEPVNYPACASLPHNDPGRCIENQVGGGGQRQYPGWRYKFPNDVCLRAKTDCKGCLEQAYMRGAAYDPDHMNEAFYSCSDTSDTRWPEAKVVEYPACAAETDYTKKCIYKEPRDTGSRMFPNWQYKLPDGRCVRAKAISGGCGFCLEKVWNYRSAVDEDWLKETFTECDPQNGPLNLPGKVVNFPECMDNEDPRNPCVMKENGGAKQFKGWKYKMAFDRCVKAKTTCTHCLDALGKVSAGGVRGNRWALQYEDKFNSEFESCAPNFDTRFARPRGGEFDANNDRDGCNHPRYGENRCAFFYSGMHKQLNGYEYKVYNRDGCFRAKTTCLGCLDGIWKGDLPVDAMRENFDSCKDEEDTRDTSYNYRLNPKLVKWPECAVRETDKCTDRPTRGSENDTQFLNWRYNMPDGRCLKAATECNACLNGVAGSGNYWAVRNPDSFQTNFVTCDEGNPNNDTRYVVHADGEFDPNNDRNGCNHPKYGNNRCAFYGTAGGGYHKQLRGFKYKVKDRKGCFKAKTDCDGCLDGIFKGDLPLEKLEEAFESCETDRDTRDRSYNYQLTPKRVPYPECAIREKDKCTRRPTRGSENDTQFQGWEYAFPDGRCFRAKTECNACLNGVYGGGNFWAIKNWYSFDENFETCATADGRDTRFVKHGKFSMNPGGCNDNKYGNNRCAFWGAGGMNTHKQLKGYEYEIEGVKGCFKSKSNCDGCLDGIANGSLSLDKMWEHFESCSPNHDTRTTEWNNEANPKRMAYPACRGTCTEHHPRGGDIMYAGWMYDMPDGRCVKAKERCWQCLELQNGKGNLFGLEDPDYYDSKFESCDPNVETRFVRHADGVFSMDPNQEGCNNNKFGNNRCAFWGTSRIGLHKQIRGFEYKMPIYNKACFKARTNCLGCLDSIENNTESEHDININFQRCGPNGGNLF